MVSSSKKKITAVLAMLCLLLGFMGYTSGSVSPMAEAKVKAYKRYVKPDTLEVHKKAKASSQVVATIVKDKQVTQYGEQDKKGWVKISFKKKCYGFVKRGDLKKHPSLAALDALERKTMRTAITPVIEECGWEKDSEWHNTYRDYEGFSYLDSFYTFHNSKYHIRFFFLSLDYSLNFEIQVYRSSDDALKDHQDIETVDEVVEIFRKYQV